MKHFKQYISLFLAAICLLAMAACTRAKDPVKVISDDALQIGVVYADNALSGRPSYFQRIGIEKAIEQMGLSEDQLHSETEITNLTENSSKESETERETTSAEPESFTDEKGKLHVKAVPITQPAKPSASEVVSDFAEKDCKVIIFTDEIYDSFSAKASANYPDIVFLQYRGTHSDLPNVISYSENASEGFYLAGRVAAVQGAKQIGFTACKDDRFTKEWINAFGQGLKDAESDANVIVRFTGSDMDLFLEQALAQQMLTEDHCDLLIQSVYSALPMTVAASGADGKTDKNVACIGFGYDMHSDGGAGYLCSVILDFSALFLPVLQAVQTDSLSFDPITAGYVQGVVGLSALQNADAAASDALKDIENNWAAHKKVDYSVITQDNGYVSNITVK